ncbi:MAG: hypothetical protein ABI670_01165 [Chloroflexota bacterium]
MNKNGKQTLTTQTTAVWRGKRDAWSRARGGFRVYLMSDGNYAYWHYGTPPNVRGDLDSGAEFIESWSYTAAYGWKCHRRRDNLQYED